ncbi:hypothetical protein WKW80_02360 [Variovorax humicola]|uniref:DUF5668 domain-containing protein n=1 Tax=Variovorax humicola TaxID=1769758 RepID=A0ABU8VTT4_9BURK
MSSTSSNKAPAQGGAVSSKRELLGLTCGFFAVFAGLGATFFFGWALFGSWISPLYLWPVVLPIALAALLLVCGLIGDRLRSFSSVFAGAGAGLIVLALFFTLV